MTQATAAILTRPDLLDNARDWTVSLQAANRSPSTIDGYNIAVRLFDQYLAAQGMPRRVARLTRDHVDAFVAHMLANGRPATAANRYRSLQQFFKYLVAEGEIKATRNPMANTKPPTVPEAPPPVLTNAQLTALLDTCRKGTGFEDRRDFALLQLIIRTGIRRGELVGMRHNAANREDPETNDFDRDTRTIRVLGKGRRIRRVSVDHEAYQALTRYIKRRDEHPRADLPWLWLGHRGKLTGTGVFQMVRRRGREAGLGRMYVHLFRHAAASYDMAAGMSETDVMNKFGWKSASMLRRYGASAAEERSLAAQERFSRGKL